MTEQILVNGMECGTRDPLMSPMDYDEFVAMLLGALGRPKELFRADAPRLLTAVATRGVFEFHSPDLCDPLATKWALLLPPKSGETEEIAVALRPLVEHRQGQIMYLPPPSGPMSFEDWIIDEYSQMLDDVRPYYLLLAGNPQAIPFRFQYLLDVHAAVGRISFDQVDDYAVYAQKVIDFETNVDASVTKRAVIFAPDSDSPTFLSRNYMTNPLADMVEQKGIPVSYLAGDAATLDNLLEEIQGDGASPAPALVYTASHGLGVTGPDEDARRRLQGALCCQDYDGDSGVFSAERVPDTPFLHGSIVFSFACYGAGTPLQSDFLHWIKIPSLLRCRSEEAFVAALPQRLLGHPRGPLAFIGHIDPAWVHSFADPKNVANAQGWGSRMAPFLQAVGQLLEGATAGYSAKKFNELYALLSTRLANIEDQFQRDNTQGQNPQWTRRMVDIWMTRNDTQNFIILGDPAVSARMA